MHTGKQRKLLGIPCKLDIAGCSDAVLGGFLLLSFLAKASKLNFCLKCWPGLVFPMSHLWPWGLFDKGRDHRSLVFKCFVLQSCGFRWINNCIKYWRNSYIDKSSQDTSCSSCFFLSFWTHTGKKWSLGSVSCSIWSEGDKDKLTSSCSVLSYLNMTLRALRNGDRRRHRVRVLQLKNQPPVLATPLGRVAECRFQPQQTAFLICSPELFVASISRV